MTQTVLVVAAHPDDEVLGCGGTIRRHVEGGDRVEVMFLADGVGARAPVNADSDIRLRRAAAERAALTLGTSPPRFLAFPDNRLDSVPLLDIVQAVETVISEVLPAVLYVHHGGDLNVDHRIAHQAAVTACRPLPGACVRAIYAFETPSSTEWGTESMGENFRPQRIVDISSVLDRKIEALREYDEEVRMFPHPRSIEGIHALTQLRGCQAGLTAAEAFVVIRDIVVAETRPGS
ncbi:MAG: LmbE family N-acetylglucosaminyl deacetylase [Hyphomicrobiaceae bacterium]|jgi:LmbE family N-acetylglucosaminyl deacetylase